MKKKKKYNNFKNNMNIFITIYRKNYNNKTNLFRNNKIKTMMIFHRILIKMILYPQEEII